MTIDDILQMEVQGVGIRFRLNPELNVPKPVETEETSRKTCAALEELDRTKPRGVLAADKNNPASDHAVCFVVGGKKISYIKDEQARILRPIIDASPRGVLPAQLTYAVIKAHGYYFLKILSVPSGITPKIVTVNWQPWKNIRQCIPDYYYIYEAEMAMIIFDEILPRLSSVSSDEITLRINQWMDAIRFNHSDEVRCEVDDIIPVLSADERAEVRQLVDDIAHLRTNMSNNVVMDPMTKQWWPEILHSEDVGNEFRQLLLRCHDKRELLLAELDTIESRLRPLRGNAYAYIGSDCEFFRQLRYLAPPLEALKGILSDYAIRTLLCEHLRVSKQPFYGSRVEWDQAEQLASAAYAAGKNGGTLAGSGIYLSKMKGVKIRFILVINSMYECGWFVDEFGNRPFKKDVFIAIGKALNIDLSQYHKNLSQSHSSNTMTPIIEPFAQLQSKAEEIYNGK